MKKTVKKGAVIEEKITEIFINGKNTVAMSNIDRLKDILVVRSMAYLLPQVGQKRL